MSEMILSNICWSCCQLFFTLAFVLRLSYLKSDNLRKQGVFMAMHSTTTLKLSLLYFSFKSLTFPVWATCGIVYLRASLPGPHGLIAIADEQRVLNRVHLATVGVWKQGGHKINRNILETSDLSDDVYLMPNVIKHQVQEMA